MYYFPQPSQPSTQSIYYIYSSLNIFFMLYIDRLFLDIDMDFLWISLQESSIHFREGDQIWQSHNSLIERKGWSIAFLIGKGFILEHPCNILYTLTCRLAMVQNTLIYPLLGFFRGLYILPLCIALVNAVAPKCCQFIVPI